MAGDAIIWQRDGEGGADEWCFPQWAVGADECGGR